MLTSERIMMVGRVRGRRLVKLETDTGLDEKEAQEAWSHAQNENEKAKIKRENGGPGDP